MVAWRPNLGISSFQLATDVQPIEAQVQEGSDS
jgi:hypothetical protein